MRVLIIGSNRTYNTNCGIHQVRKFTDTTWDVVSSYQAACEEWKTLPHIGDVWPYQSLKDNEADEERGLVIEVLADAFYTKSWVKRRMKESADLILISSSPVSHMDSSMLKSFHQILLTKTNSIEKLKQYHNLFLDKNRTDLKTFKKVIKALSTQQYLSVLSDGTFQILNSTLDSVATADSKTTDSSDVLETQSSELKSTELKPAPAPSSVPIKCSRLPRPDCVKLDDVPVDFCERWVCFQATYNLDEAVQEFEKMLGNNLILAMFDNPSIERHPKTRTADFYFQVKNMRKDLFASLMMNILEALRARHSITHGTLVV